MQQLNKGDIDLLMEIRRRLKREGISSLQLSSPTLFDDLIGCWHQTEDAITRSRIRFFLERMGDKWAQKLKKTMPKLDVVDYR